MLSVGDAPHTEIWDCSAWVSGSDLTGATCGVNGLSYNEAWDTYTFSLRSHETVLEWDAGTGEVLWYSDPHGGRGYTVSPVEAHWL